jgi:hypothetical protein
MLDNEWPNPPPLFVYDSVTVFEDYPWSFNVDVVSGKLRSLLERLAPGVAEYWPIRLKGPRSDQLPDSYWAVNWLRVVDCLHEETFNVNDEGRRYVEVPVIDPAMIPGDVVLAVVEHFRVMKIIRDDLRLELIKAGIRGPQYGRMASIDRPETITWTKVDWSKPKKKERLPPAPKPPPMRLPPKLKRGKAK